MSRLRTFVLACLLAVPSIASAQATNISHSSSLPAACRPGDAYVKTGTTPGWYVCITTNTWSFWTVSPATVANGGTGLTAGTSGGVLAFTGSTTLTSSGVLTANLPVIGGGAGAVPTVGTRSGNTTQFVTTTGALTSGDCVSIDASGNFIAAGGACGVGSGSVSNSGTLTANQLMIGAGTTVIAALGSLGTTTTLLHGNAGGAPTFGQVANADLAGSIAASKLVGTDITTVGTITSGVWTGTTIGVANGGTGLTAGTSGGVLAYTATGTLASSGVLSANLPVIGGGSGVAPTVGTRSGNTTKFVTTTGTLTNGDCVSWDSNGNAVAAGAGCVTASSTNTFTNKTIDAEGSGNSITIPFTYIPVIAICQNTTASLGASTPTSNPAVAACVTGSNTQLAVAQFADGASTLSVQGHFSLASDWTGNIDLAGKWRTSATSGAVVWQISTICVADGETVDPSFNTASTVTETAKGTTLQLNDFTISSVTVTGCSAGEELFYRFFRDPTNGSDTLAATAELVSMFFTVRRTM